MGKISNIMNYYFSDSRHFANLFNAIFFQGRFHTEVALLFRALQYRGDRIGLKKLLENDFGYRHLDRDTLEAIAVLLKLPAAWEKRNEFMRKIEDREEYDMCLAVREWEAEAKRIGRKEGRTAIIKNMLRRGYSCEEIAQVAECNREYVEKIRRTMH